MRTRNQIFILIATIIVGYTIRKIREVTSPVRLPKFNHNQYWGSGLETTYTEDQSIKPFNIQFSKEEVEILRRKLNDVEQLHPPLEGTNFEYGINSDYLKNLSTYWRNDYLSRWQERQDFFNQFSHFRTNIQGLNIHFIHAKPTGKTKGKKIFPLLLLHGWPGSVREFYDLIPLLTQPSDDRDYVFEVIAPSLPGYGWSDGAKKVGLGALEIAIVLRNLMARLDFEKYYIQGGDWGSLIGSNIATIYPDDVLGYHSNFCNVQTTLSSIKMIISSIYPSWFVEKEHQSMYYPLRTKLKFIIQEIGYLRLLATKPDTIGHVLDNNPIALASFILCKFSYFFDSIDRDALIDNLMVYYMTKSFTTAGRIYAETLSEREFAYKIDRVQTKVPSGCVRFPIDLFHSIDWQLKDKYTNLIHSTHSTIGGHFAALEVPDLLYADLIKFVNKTLKL